jgi:hypothetical protein
VHVLCLLVAEAKAALLEWVRQQVAPTGVPIENFTTTYVLPRVVSTVVFATHCRLHNTVGPMVAHSVL